MWNARRDMHPPFAASSRMLALAALTTALVLGAATAALPQDRDNNPPGPRGGPGTNWENPPGPRGGPGASPDPKPYRPWTLRRIFNAQNPPPGPNPWARRRIFNSITPPRPHRVRPHPRRPVGAIRRR